ncbi:MAG TPA: type II toxin-antitoxin system VapC family toxin [Candidatus Binatia bacterium]
MSFAYFDTSALVKRYVRERGSAQVGSLLRRHDCLSSAITPVEVLSALGGKKRSGDLSEQEFSTLMSRIQSERIRWELVEITGQVLSWAEEVIHGPLPLRTLDALHVASSMVFQAVSSIEIPFVTGDVRQRDAATHLGLDVVWVG